MVFKTCSTCRRDLPLTEYWRSRNGRTRDGYKGECKECAKRRRREWAAKNRERESQYSSKKYLANPELAKARARSWQEANSERYREICRMKESARRARKRDAFIEDVDPAVVYAMHGGRCGICGEFVSRDNFHVDHITPWHVMVVMDILMCSQRIPSVT